MPARREFPIEALKVYRDLLDARRDLPVRKVAAIFMIERPELFPTPIDPRSAHSALLRSAERQGVHIEQRPSGSLFVPAPKQTFLRRVPEMTFKHQERVVMVSDLHASGHLNLYVERLRAVIEELEIPFGVFMGDQLNNDHVPHKGRSNEFAATAQENIEAFADIANILTAAGLRTKKVIQGNHDDKVLRALPENSVLYPEWWASKIAPELDDPESWDVTHRYYCTMEPEVEGGWPFPEGHRHFPWLFMHQSEYSKIPLRTAMFHATKRLANVVCGHQHHLGFTKHESGVFYVADAGTGQDPSLASYKETRPTKHPEWAPGFLVLINNHLMSFPLDLSEDEFKRRLRQ